MIDREAFNAYAANLGIVEQREPCFVYLMRCDRYVKIGIAADVEVRRERLQLATPLEVTVGSKYGFRDRRYAFMTERSAHEELAALRTYGEWFDMEFDLADHVVRETAKAARKLMRSRTIGLKDQYETLWRQYVTDKALQAEVSAFYVKRLESFVGRR